MDQIKAVSMVVDHQTLGLYVLYSTGEIILISTIDDAELQVRPPDVQTHIVGMCRDCKKPVYELQEYEYSEKEEWFRHKVEEDCDMSDQKLGVCVPSKKKVDEKPD